MEENGDLLYSETRYAQALRSRDRSREILRVAKEMAEKQHPTVVEKVMAAHANRKITKRTRDKILRSLNTRTR